MRTWVKLHTRIVEDPKMALLDDHLFRVCILLFAIGGREDRDGRLGTTAEIAYWLRSDAETTAADLQQLAEKNVTCNKNGIWSLKNWDKHQSRAPSAAREAVAARVRKSRENKENVTSLHADGNEDVTTLHAARNDPREEKKRIEEEGADAPPPAKKASPYPPAVQAFISAAHRTPNKSLHQSMAEAIGEKPADLAFWGQVVTAWIAKGWNPANIAGMFDYYQRRELPPNGKAAPPPGPKPPKGKVYT